MVFWGSRWTIGEQLGFPFLSLPQSPELESHGRLESALIASSTGKALPVLSDPFKKPLISASVTPLDRRSSRRRMFSRITRFAAVWTSTEASTPAR
jgi:hypothetical protein